MPLIPRRRRRARLYHTPRRALTGASLAPNENGSPDPFVTLHQPWQDRAFGFYDTMGECWNPANFASRQLAKIRLYPATGDKDDPEEIEAGWAADLVAQWSAVPESFGRLDALIGEGRLCQSRGEGALDQGVVWEYLSPTELSKSTDGKKIRRKVGSSTIEYDDLSNQEGAGDPEPGQMRMWRFWRPHPRNSGLADSAFAGVLNLYDQLWWLTMAERSELRSRAVLRGLLLIDDDIEFETPGMDDIAMDEDPEVDPFNELLHAVIAAALQNPGSAEAAAPPVIRAPGELLHPDRFRLLELHDRSDSLFTSDRERSLIQRIALGLDMPAAEVAGKGEMNHWNTWKNEDDKYQHVQPAISRLCSDLTNAVLRPLARANSAADAEIFVAADVSELTTDPDKGKTAIVLHEHGLVGDEYARAANDVPEDAEPSDEEMNRYLAIKLRDATLVGGGDTAGDPTENPSGTTPDQNESPPVDDGTDGETASSRFAQAAAAIAWAHVATFLASRKRSCPDCYALIDGLPDDRKPGSLGDESLKGLGVSKDDIERRFTLAFWKALDQMGCSVPVQDSEQVDRWLKALVWKNQTWPREISRRIFVLR